ncbi:MAG: uracil-DNA glycosylase [Oscillospiraceae bacterium]|nr:uracil-DNA glycosylase [Oscillospiraceae bacterium]
MEGWEALEQKCLNCTGCGLCETRHHVVFGVGNRETDVLFVGEGPGEQEDLQGEPFVGPAGKLLDDMLSIVDIDRGSNCYIANIVKCRPPRNRDPLETEQEACIGYLRNQVALIRPKIIVCLGRIAAKKLIDPDFRITRQHGQWFRRGDFWMMATFHPSALLRDVSKRPEAFDDLMALRAKMKELGVEK